MKSTKSSKKRSKIGQVSLEFLTTYGWAFLVALIAIGALAYFGVLNPSKYTPKRCNFGSEVNCNDFRIAKDPATNTVTVNFRLTNSIGSSVIINAATDLNVTNKAATQIICGTVVTPAAFPFTWNDGASQDFQMTCSGAAPAGNTGSIIRGEKTKLNVWLRYYDPVSGASYTHLVNGELYDQVQ